ncbi:hypothetical protein EUX98_g924 [Antrodiella citrinella]|uniref:Uncharacterized protein n=1 Tax=Antrodiella citrinella TaxID=2447956 RepID=A0A4S4N4F4_9APHY|nr:hypothetical protein EUX98_g924 [Antrodiella citrinella]
MDSLWAVEQNVLTAFSLIGFFVSIIPLAVRYRAWNTGSILYVSWNAVQCLVQFVNLLVWRHSDRDIAPGWCDLSVRITWMAGSGMVCSGLLISRTVCKIMTGAPVPQDRPEKIRALAIELAIGLGLPCLQLIVFYILQDQRYNIYEGVGCFYSISVTWLYVVLYGGWLLAISLVSCIYCSFSLYTLFRRRKLLKELTSDNTSGLTFNRYIRLSIMSFTQLACVFPLIMFILIFLVPQLMAPYKGFKAQHAMLSQVDIYQLDAWFDSAGEASYMRTIFETTYWLFISASLCFFGIFCFSASMKTFYRKAYGAALKLVGRSAGDEGAIESNIVFGGLKLMTCR